MKVDVSLRCLYDFSQVLASVLHMIAHRGTIAVRYLCNSTIVYGSREESPSAIAGMSIDD